MVSIMPKTVTAETAATPNARFLFFSILRSSFNLDNKSVTFTFPWGLLNSCWLLF
jgi:hypothetical protein